MQAGKARTSNMGPRIRMILASWLGHFIHNNFGKASKVPRLPPKVLIRLGQCGSAVDCRESSKPKCLLDGTLRVSTLRILTNLTLRFQQGYSRSTRSMDVRVSQCAQMIMIIDTEASWSIPANRTDSPCESRPHSTDGVQVLLLSGYL